MTPLTRILLASPDPGGLFYSIGGSTATLDPNGLFFAGCRGLASLSSGAGLKGPPVGFDVGILVGPAVGLAVGVLVGPAVGSEVGVLGGAGVMFRSCGHRLWDRPLVPRLLLPLLVVLLTREPVFACKGKLFPRPTGAVRFDRRDDANGTASARARRPDDCFDGRAPAAPSAFFFVVLAVGGVGVGRGSGGTAALAARDLVVTVDGLVWYVDNSYAGANGTSDGSYLRPFTQLTELNGGTGDGTTNDDVDGTGQTNYYLNADEWAQAQTATVASLAQVKDPGLLLRLYRERMPKILGQAGSVTTVNPKDDSRLIIQGAAQ